LPSARLSAPTSHLPDGLINNGSRRGATFLGLGLSFGG